MYTLSLKLTLVNDDARKVEETQRCFEDAKTMIMKN